MRSADTFYLADSKTLLYNFSPYNIHSLICYALPSILQATSLHQCLIHFISMPEGIWLQSIAADSLWGMDKSIIIICNSLVFCLIYTHTCRRPLGSCIYIRQSTCARGNTISARGIINTLHFCTRKKALISPTITDFWLKFNPTITACLIPYIRE